MTISINRDLKVVNELLRSKKPGYVILYFIRYNRHHEPIIYRPVTEYKVQKKLMRIFTNYFEDPKVQEKDRVDFNIMTGDNDEISLLKLNVYSRVQNLIELINDHSKHLTDMSELNLGQVSGYAVKIKSHNDASEIIYFSTINNLKKLNNSGIMANLDNNRLKSLDKEDVFGLNPMISSYTSDDENLLILNKSSFENIFKMREFYKEEAKPILKFIESFKAIGNYQEFFKDVTNNSNLARRVARLSDKKARIELLLRNISRVKEATEVAEYKEDFKDIKIEKGKIIYENEYKDAFITLISDKAVESFITKKKFIE